MSGRRSTHTDPYHHTHHPTDATSDSDAPAIADSNRDQGCEPDPNADLTCHATADLDPGCPSGPHRDRGFRHRTYPRALANARPREPSRNGDPGSDPHRDPQPALGPTPRLAVRNRVTLVTHGAPPNLNIMDRSTLQAQLATDSLGDPLMLMDFGTGRLVPRLSEGWEMLGAGRWRFLLRQDVKFHNGEAFDAEAAAWAINWQADPPNASHSGRHILRTRATATGRSTLR